MKKYFLAAAAVAALGAAAPASAQIFPQNLQGLFGGGSAISSRLAMLDRQINLAFQRGEISRGEAARLQSELVQLSQLEQSYRIDGLNRAERRDLEQRLQMLERNIQLARFDRRYDDRWNDNDRRFGNNGCPPGLAKKNNGCMPPGLARQGNRAGAQYGSQYNPMYGGWDSQRYIYRQEGGRTLQIDRRTGQVVRVFDTRRW